MQPSQLYISAEKLAKVLRGFDPSHPEQMEAIPIRRLDGSVVMTDGHTRAFAAFLCGLRDIPAVWDRDELDWEAYRICVAWCREAGVNTVADLAGRVLAPGDYQALWLERCRRMHEELATKRGARSD
jgi:hypothetical protein